MNFSFTMLTTILSFLYFTLGLIVTVGIEAQGCSKDLVFASAFITVTCMGIWLMSIFRISQQLKGEGKSSREVVVKVLSDLFTDVIKYWFKDNVKDQA